MDRVFLASGLRSRPWWFFLEGRGLWAEAAPCWLHQDSVAPAVQRTRCRPLSPVWTLPLLFPWKLPVAQTQATGSWLPGRALPVTPLTVHSALPRVGVARPHQSPCCSHCLQRRPH